MLRTCSLPLIPVNMEALTIPGMLACLALQTPLSRKRIARMVLSPTSGDFILYLEFPFRPFFHFFSFSLTIHPPSVAVAAIFCRVAQKNNCSFRSLIFRYVRTFLSQIWYLQISLITSSFNSSRWLLCLITRISCGVIVRKDQCSANPVIVMSAWKQLWRIMTLLNRYAFSL